MRTGTLIVLGLVGAAVVWKLQSDRQVQAAKEAAATLAAGMNAGTTVPPQGNAVTGPAVVVHASTVPIDTNRRGRRPANPAQNLATNARVIEPETSV